MISIPAVLIIAFFAFFIGMLLGSTKRGLIAFTANEIPRCYLTVIYSDKYCTVLREIGIKSRYYLVSTVVFGGKPIRPKDRVRHIKTNKERKDLGIPVLGYPPLIKVTGEE